MDTSQSTDHYISKHSKWQEELLLLRSIMRDTEMEETIKWGAPVYTVNGKNVIGLGAFKNHCGVWFFNGVFLTDPNKVLVNTQEGTKSLRQLRFESYGEIDPVIVRKYVDEAIQNQKDGKEVKPTTAKKKLNIPAELNDALNQPKLQHAFSNLTPGRQREYADYVSSAKQEKTRLSRVEKITPMILAGKGLNDKYRDC